MPLNLDENQANYQIKSYKPGYLKINTQIFTKSVIVSPNHLIDDWAPQTVNELTFEALQIAASEKPDILLIGTGEKLAFLPLELYGDFINQGIGIEIMDTSAACRTYNVLTSENRNVVAALIIR